MTATIETSPISAPSTAHELVEAFAQLGPMWVKWLHQTAEPAGITPARLRLLGALHYGGPQVMHELADQLGSTPRNITTLVDGVERDGLARRQRHPTDRRAIIVELTDKGEQLVDSWWEQHLDRTAAVFAELPERDQRTLLRIVGRLGDAFARVTG